ncbi:hypothetical protein FSP39_005286 [Pinctada imbricata]|uniref:Uncharacterized protein n=1 Tax=Pinctada imbricata TaxID=66713 RepID=A0AA89BZY1_PINIB|nr:hypothetical protein FSP39_005286 [Pinctada imbricata]
MMLTEYLLVLFLFSIFSEGTNNKELELHKMFEEKLQAPGFNFVRPVDDYKTPIQVNVTLWLISINAIDERSQVFQATVWFEMSWMDRNMSWSESDFNEVGYIILPSKRVWTPDICIMNELTNNKCINADDNLAILSYGKIEWWKFRDLKLTCSIDIVKYPFDKQTCSVNIGTWHSGDNAVRLTTTREIALQSYQKNSVWNLINTSSKYVTSVYSSDFTEIHFQIGVSRKSGFFVYNVILPVLLLSILTIFCFFLPIQSGEKSSFAITVFLSMAVFMSMIIDSLPKQSHGNFRLGSYLTVQLIMSCITIVMEIFVINLFYGKTNDKIAKFLIAIFLCGNEGKYGNTDGNENQIDDNIRPISSKDYDIDRVSIKKPLGSEISTVDREVAAQRLENICCIAVSLTNIVSFMVYMIDVNV